MRSRLDHIAWLILLFASLLSPLFSSGLAFAGSESEPAIVNEGGLTTVPIPGQRIVWEFAIGVDQLNKGAAERSPVASKGDGVGSIEYDTTTHQLHYRFSFRGLNGRVTDIQLLGPAHPHQSTTRRLTALARQEFADASGEDDGYWEGEHQLQAASQPGFERLAVRSILAVMVSGRAYVKIVTTASEDGEIRGNIGTARHAAKP